MVFGSTLLNEDKELQSQVSIAIKTEFADALERVDNNLAMLVGSMQEEVWYDGEGLIYRISYGRLYKHKLKRIYHLSLQVTSIWLFGYMME